MFIKENLIIWVFVEEYFAMLEFCCRILENWREGVGVNLKIWSVCVSWDQKNVNCWGDIRHWGYMLCLTRQGYSTNLEIPRKGRPAFPMEGWDFLLPPPVATLAINPPIKVYL